MDGKGNIVEIKKSPNFTEKYSPALLICPLNGNMFMMDVLRNNFKLMNDPEKSTVNREPNWESDLRIYFTVDSAKVLKEDLERFLNELEEKNSKSEDALQE